MKNSPTETADADLASTVRAIIAARPSLARDFSTAEIETRLAEFLAGVEQEARVRRLERLSDD